jgi:hypothetical protein
LVITGKKTEMFVSKRKFGRLLAEHHALEARFAELRHDYKDRQYEIAPYVVLETTNGYVTRYQSGEYTTNQKVIDAILEHLGMELHTEKAKEAKLVLRDPSGPEPAE